MGITLIPLHVFCIVMFLFIMNLTIGKTSNNDKNCDVENEMLVCVGEIPTAIYGGVTTVYVKEYSRESIAISTFDDASWGVIKVLIIEVEEGVNLKMLENRTFQSLNQLTELTFRCSHLQKTDTLAFTGLNDLKLLNLSGNVFLGPDSLLIALQEIRSIDTLLLEGLSTMFHEIFYVRQDFFNTILAKGIRNISLAHTTMYIEKMTFPDGPLPLLALNLSNSQSFLQDIEYDLDAWLSLFGNLIVLDLSKMDHRTFDILGESQHIHLDCISGLQQSNFMFFLRLEKLFFNDVKLPEVVVSDDSIVNASGCQINLQVLQLRSVYCKRFNVTFYWPMDSPLIDFDMSGNEMEHLSIKGYITISRLKLSHNQLYRMQNSPDYPLLMDAMPVLEEVDLDNNGLTYIPKDIFRRNSRLKYIRMHDNYLTRFNVDIAHLHSLIYLDLRRNKLKFIETKYLNVFDNLQNLQASMNRTPVFDIDLRNNEIECSCSNLKFIKWIVSKNQINPGTLYHMACYIDGRNAEMIHQGTLKYVDSLCKRTLVIVLCSGFGLVCLAIVFGAIVFFIRRRTKTRIRRFTERFKTRKTKEKFLALISHSKHDGKVVYEHIRQNLEQAMRNVLQVDFDLLCLGDLHFRPGMAIVDEIYKSVSESCVAMFVISRAFCESGWCKCELKEAYGQNKPIILMFLEEVDEENMTPLMQNMFHKYTRVKLTQHNGEGDVVVSQSWDSISQSIIYLAADECKNRRHICF